MHDWQSPYVQTTYRRAHSPDELACCCARYDDAQHSCRAATLQGGGNPDASALNRKVDEYVRAERSEGAGLPDRHRHSQWPIRVCAGRRVGLLPRRSWGAEWPANDHRRAFEWLARSPDRDVPPLRNAA